MACYTSIGIFASTLSDNQIIAFLVGILVCFLIFNGFDAIATLFSDGETQQTVQSLGAKAHFDSIARGVIDTRDLMYFISLTLVFLHLTFQRLKQLPR
jgi:ABC-2 type transport system permease protein